MTYKSKVALCFEIRTKHSTQSEHHVESCMYSFGYFPGVRLWFADVSEPSISSIFKGWM